MLACGTGGCPSLLGGVIIRSWAYMQTPAVTQKWATGFAVRQSKYEVGTMGLRTPLVARGYLQEESSGKSYGQVKSPQGERNKTIA